MTRCVQEACYSERVSQDYCATQALTAPEHDVKIFKEFRQLCGQTGLLPASHIIPESFVQTTEHPVASGGFGDVWEGIYNGERVAIKALRVYKNDNVKKVAKASRSSLVIPAGRPS